MECSQIVRRQSNNCPICRTKVSTFIQIKDDHSNNVKSSKQKEVALKKLQEDVKQETTNKAAVDNEDGDEEDEEEEDEGDLEEFKNAPRAPRNEVEPPNA